MTQVLILRGGAVLAEFFIQLFNLDISFLVLKFHGWLMYLEGGGDFNINNYTDINTVF